MASGQSLTHLTDPNHSHSFLYSPFLSAQSQLVL